MREAGLSIQEAECHLDTELFLNVYPRWDIGEPHHPFILQQMFIHATEARQKEAERLICHGCQQGLPNLDSGADIPAIQLVGHQMSSKEIGDLYCQVYALRRLPWPLLCGPERAQWITEDIVSSLKDCLRWRKGELPERGGGSESTAMHPSCHRS